MNRFVVGVLVTAILALTAAPLTASADQSVDPAVAYALAEVPGGVLLTPSSAEWPSLGMRIDAPDARARSVGTCATGAICAYSGVNRSGTKLSWTSCGTKSTAALSTVGSIANARSSGVLNANAGSVVRASAGAGASTNVAAAYQSAITSVSC